MTIPAQQMGQLGRLHPAQVRGHFGRIPFLAAAAAGKGVLFELGATGATYAAGATGALTEGGATGGTTEGGAGGELTAGGATGTLTEDPC